MRRWFLAPIVKLFELVLVAIHASNTQLHQQITDGFAEQEKHFMTTKSDIDTLIASVNDVTNAIAAQTQAAVAENAKILAALQAATAGSITDADLTNWKNMLTGTQSTLAGVSTQLVTIGQDPANPVPVAPPAPAPVDPSAPTT